MIRAKTILVFWRMVKMKTLILALVIFGVTSSADAQSRRNTANYGPGARGTAEWGKTMSDPAARKAAGRARNCSMYNRGCDTAKK